MLGLGFNRLCLRNMNGEDTVFALAADCLGVDVIREREPALERPVETLRPMTFLVLVLPSDMNAHRHVDGDLAVDARLEKEFGMRFQAADLQQISTVRDLADVISKSGQECDRICRAPLQ